ncbi:MAG TPA: class I SAM-dependent methyltransferase [Allosphingosinicella sp.]
MLPSNTFAAASDAYALARPSYPQSLVKWIPAQSPGTEAVWDCATGNGQAAVGLANRFGRVEATDIAPEQVRHGKPHPNIHYSAQPAEATRFADDAFDVVTVAQALHWFDFPRFWPEVRRVARPGALFCAWGYAWFRYGGEVEAALIEPVKELVAPYWAANNRILWDGYPDEATGFPFERIAAPPFELTLDTTAEQIAAYVRTWSAFKRASASSPELARTLDKTLSAGLETLGANRPVRAVTPLAVVAGRVS